MSRRPVGLLLGAGALVLLAGCGGSGLERAGESDAFSTCVQDAGASLDGSSDWDVDEQLRFWGRDGTLACATEHLDDDELTEALADGFVDPDEVDDTVRVGQAQQSAVRRLSVDVAATRGEDDAVAAAGRVLGAAPAGDDRVLRRVAALGVVEGTSGLPGYADFLATNGLDDDADALTRYDDQVETDGPDDLRARLSDLAGRIGEAT